MIELSTNQEHVSNLIDQFGVFLWKIGWKFGCKIGSPHPILPTTPDFRFEIGWFHPNSGEPEP